MSKIKALRQLRIGDRVRVTGTVEQLMKLEIPRRFAERATGKLCVVCRQVSDSASDVALSLGDPNAENNDYWYFHPKVLDLPEDTSDPTIYVTARLATAQDLLHQCLSIDSQIKNMGASTHGMLNVIDTLRAVMGDEIDKQMKENKSNGKE